MTVRQITEAQAKKHSAKGTVVIDLRDPVAYRDGSLPGSKNYTLRQISTLSAHPKDKTLVVVGDPVDPSTLSAAVRYLEAYGLMNISVFTPPPAWKP
jgi:Rhodanese-like domain